ncbi:MULTISPECIES: hypothetical protein [unclassified Lentimonas]|uniref:hypothetical protein n=1 Tax=unclassified Lentimonas TaxID=2630993 RepID=UPI00132936ED|nr:MULTISPECIES: hypothetical protein [unclassified Lentimonas]CAA6689809.1 Unannotated [Lentimonas sp. CC19]CAA6690664.1 Unannotated [Lentimonas sp. CC10]CAA7068918.1 Unannotated [Lentimonas sp. CC11]
MSNTWIWISGWGICPDRFKAAAEAALPNYSHEVLAPTPDAFEAVLRSGAKRIGGYSLGSLILLSELARVPEDAEVTCLAPFTAFCKESRMGGTTPRASLGILQMRLELQPEKAIKLFYRLSGLTDEPTRHLPYPVEDLTWGLEQLAGLQADTALLCRVKGYVGLTDALVRGIVLNSHWSKCQLIDNCSHSYHELFASLPQIETY